MKTLHEVISALEEYGDFVAECSYCSAEYCDGTLEVDRCYIGEALHYLKEYRDRKETLRNWTEKAISEQQNLSDAITFMQAYRKERK